MPRAERRVQLLDVARKIVEDEGIGALTMSAIADHSGTSKPVVYEHFENSEAVAVAILDDYFQNAITFVTQRVTDAENIDQYMHIVIDSLFEYHQKQGSAVRKVTNGFSSTSYVNTVYLEQQKRSVDVYRDLIQQQGVAKNVSLVAAYAVMEMINAAVLEFGTKPNNSIARDAVKRMVSGAIHSLVPEHGQKPVTPPGILKYRAHRRSRSRQRS